ncbi:uncharacterized protein K460DRAFT_395213 [Cucurbitaria berberidis CBS 394.84]|uniref:Uncharacterized protein n=1 Tax=Cucurbitaria berberidis CBS 394.84 TaxID=1168544 RepID=A0A9P4GI07_9PLEO|nr:uncharacterized protein K460DRAFT_395213 [Cucurbitaria berberidis CBS 394.84]KAF1845589.1 hypothetical protein K460DRAFT_395213 [Cucurbitaria berberidis CBS 394.84]
MTVAIFYPMCARGRYLCDRIVVHRGPEARALQESNQQTVDNSATTTLQCAQQQQNERDVDERVLLYNTNLLVDLDCVAHLKEQLWKNRLVLRAGLEGLVLTTRGALKAPSADTPTPRRLEVRSPEVVAAGLMHVLSMTTPTAACSHTLITYIELVSSGRRPPKHPRFAQIAAHHVFSKPGEQHDPPAQQYNGTLTTLGSGKCWGINKKGNQSHAPPGLGIASHALQNSQNTETAFSQGSGACIQSSELADEARRSNVRYSQSGDDHTPQSEYLV